MDDITSSSSRPRPKKQSTDISTFMSHEMYGIVVGIEISNMTKYSLIDPITKELWGKVPKPAFRVLPEDTVVMIARKYGYTISGVSGFASWLIEGSNGRIFIYWECPYFGCNKLAVGFITNASRKYDEAWIDDIRNKRRVDGLVYEFVISDAGSEEITAGYEGNHGTFKVSQRYYGNRL